MSLSADIERATLSVLLDVRHPLAALALRPAVDFGASLGIGINWLPLSVRSLRAPTRPEPEDDRGIRHRRFRAQAITREIETYAAVQGLVMREFYRDGSAEAANLGWLWMRHRYPERLVPYLDALFRGYWSLELDVSSPRAIAALLESILGREDTDFEVWAAGEGPGVANALAAELRSHGLFQVPAFVVEEEVFYGRQHLPMIRWLLEGRRGPGPI